MLKKIINKFKRKTEILEVEKENYRELERLTEDLSNAINIKRDPYANVNYNFDINITSDIIEKLWTNDLKSIKYNSRNLIFQYYNSETIGYDVRTTDFMDLYQDIQYIMTKLLIGTKQEYSPLKILSITGRINNMDCCTHLFTKENKEDMNFIITPRYNFSVHNHEYNNIIFEVIDSFIASPFNSEIKGIECKKDKVNLLLKYLNDEKQKSSLCILNQNDNHSVLDELQDKDVFEIMYSRNLYSKHVIDDMFFVNNDLNILLFPSATDIDRALELGLKKIVIVVDDKIDGECLQINNDNLTVNGEVKYNFEMEINERQ